MNESINNQNNNFQMERNIRESERKPKGLIALVIILFIAVLGLSVYIYYDNFLVKDDNNEQENENKDNDVKEDVVKMLDVDSTLVKGLYSMMQYPNYPGDQIYYEKEKTLSNNLQNDYKLRLALETITDNCSAKEIGLNEFDSAIKKVFGDSTIYSKDSISCESYSPYLCYSYKFDSTNSKYVRENATCSDNTYGTVYMTKISKATITNNKTIEIYEKFMNEQSVAPTFKTGFGTLEKTLDGCISYNGDNYGENYKASKYECFIYFYNKLASMKYTFELNDDETSYHFVSSEVVYE